MQDPFDLLQQSIKSAKEKEDRNAGLLFLATSGDDNQPNIRTLLLREIKERELLILFSTYHQKWQQLQQNAKFEVLLWYPSIGHQYRVRGLCKFANQADLEACWHQQPDAIKKVDLAYENGFLPGDATEGLEKFQAEVAALSDAEVATASPPEHIVAAWLSASHVERLVESNNRLHERMQYVWHNDSWTQKLVIP